MRKQPDIPRRAFLVVTALAMLGISACGSPAATPAPTQTVSAIYTAAAQTFTAQQATQSASVPATVAPSQTALPGPASTSAAGAGGVPVTGGTRAPGGAAAAQCENAAYVNDVTIPDGTAMAPSKAFTKTWTVMNTGTCAWTTDYRLTFVNGESMRGTSVPLSVPVPASAQTQISVSITSPVLPGNHSGGRQLQDPQGNRFGAMITVVIVVSGTSGTSVTATP